jgi:hypothetical protein
VPALNGEERQALKKTCEVRYRQFARGRRSIKTITVPAPNAENAKKHFETTIQLMKYFKFTPLRHAQLISLFPAKEA